MGTGVRDGNAERVAQPAMKREVYPVHTLDGMKDYEAFVGTVMLFNDVLDSNLLSTTLSRLLEIGDWKKLGGRLRRDVSLTEANTMNKSMANFCSYSGKWTPSFTCSIDVFC